MNRKSNASQALRRTPYCPVWVGLVGCLLLTTTAQSPAAEAIVDIGPAATPTHVPVWDARGLGPLPGQGIASWI